MVHDKLGIENFDIASLPLSSWQILLTQYDKKRSEYQASMGERKALEKQISDVEREIVQLKTQRTNNTNKISELEKKLNTDNSTVVKQLQTEKTEIATKQETIVSSLPLQPLGLDNVYELNTYIIELVQKGKDLASKKEQTKQKVDYLENDLKKIDERKSGITQQLAIVDESRSKQQFFCTKIEDNCPFLEQINQGMFKRLDEQKSLLEKELA